MKTKRLILLLFILFPAYVLAGNRFQELYTNIHQFISQQKAEVGVAIIADGKDTVTVENNRRYPLMSVFKLHQALAVGDYCKRHQISFDTLLTVDSTDLQPNTYSPLRDRAPHGGKFSLKQLMEYTLHLSDNNACDILFDYIGGPKTTDKYVRSLGITDFSITQTERDMHESTDNVWLNWTKPSAAALLLETFLQNPMFDKNQKFFLERAMADASTGKDKLKAGLPDDVLLGHKTGSSDRNEYGIKVADNDMGFVVLPNGQYYTIAVFVMNSQETDKTNARLIADISKVVYNYFVAHYKK